LHLYGAVVKSLRSSYGSTQIAQVDSFVEELGGPRGAALRLGLKRSTLYWRMQKLGIFKTNQAAENAILSVRR
jgi:DNA invertase Pin-like site-specific DNA recombinase